MSWSERLGGFFSTPLGRLIRGIIKIALAGFLITLLGTIQNSLPPDPNIGGNTVPVRTIITLVIAFFPIAYLISAMRDLGVEI